MKTLFLTLMAVGLLSVGASETPREGTVAPELRVLELDLTRADMGRLQQRWFQEGWAVARASWSPPRGDGTLRWNTELRRLPEATPVNRASDPRGWAMVEDIGDAELRGKMHQWQQEGTVVLSISEPQPQPDGTIHRKARLVKPHLPAAPGLGYDDRLMARIKRSETTAAQLVEWFGPPDSRDERSDGRAQLAWNFGSKADGERVGSGMLSVSLAPDGKVDSYSARRGPK